MKSRTDFPTHKEYKDYLVTYYAGLAMQGILAYGRMPPSSVDYPEFKDKDQSQIMGKVSVEWAEGLVSELDEAKHLN